MTTNYTTTVGITTPDVTLDDFTSVVPGDLGVNVYGAATNADINTFDIGPTGDSNILLQTLAAGGHHVHDGVCHDSHTPTGPSYGVHGIYDKANGSLIENIEFYHHEFGQGYSARYGNTCKSCIFHDLIAAIALFNYQGAAIGPAGTLRIRDCVAYSIDPGGYFFFSDGDWKESNGTLLGPSTISVEIDHCTIDVRGVSDPFNFSDMHNDVYLTNSIIISDSGLPLSSIIVPPTDGSTVHLDGSIVLDSADAATYLGPAPTFIPIAVGGSPVIGTAVASPPVTFAQFGNEGDLGASQTGSPAPGPPPLPGPAIPGLDWFVAGGAVGGGSIDTLVIPIDVDVPRTDPTLGATIMLIFIQTVPGGSTVASVTDDAPVDDAYSLCLFEDGLNHYDATTRFGFVQFGLIVNPLIGGTNSITINMAGTTTYVEAVAVAVTGVGADWPSLPLDPAADWIATTVAGYETEQPVGGAVASATGVSWEYLTSVFSIIAPAGAADENWDWIDGVVAFYALEAGNDTDLGPWAWGDGSIDDFFQWDINAGIGFLSFALGVATVTPGAAGPSLEGTFTDPPVDLTGQGFALKNGPGPNCSTPPPPTSGTPIFNNHIRLSE